jgi:hypothetical protein
MFYKSNQKIFPVELDFVRRIKKNHIEKLLTTD